MAKTWSEAQRREKEFWSRIYLERQADIRSYSPIDADEMSRFTVMTLRRHGLELRDVEGATLVDVGCGPYGILAGLASASTGFSRKTTLVGIDPLMDFYSSELKLLRDRDGVQLLSGRAEDLPLPDESCDLAFCVNALDHVESPERAVRELHRVLKPGGLCAVSLHTVMPAFVPARRFLKYVDRNHPHHFSAGDVKRMLARCFARVELSQVVSMLEDQPEFALRYVLRSPRRLEAVMRWLSTFVLRGLYFNCRKD